VTYLIKIQKPSHCASRKGIWRQQQHSSAYSQPWHQNQVSGQLHVPADLPAGKEHGLGGFRSRFKTMWI